MANSLKHIKSVRSREDINNIQLVFEFLMGEEMPLKYDEKTSYKEKDFIVAFDDTLNKYTVLICVGATKGKFNPEKWEKISIKDYLNKDHISLGSSKDIIEINEEIPTAKNNRVWMKPIAYKDLNTEVIENGSLLVIFDGDEFRGQDDMPEEDNVKVWFDYEFDYEQGLPRN